MIAIIHEQINDSKKKTKDAKKHSCFFVDAHSKPLSDISQFQQEARP
jgi:hypothetical protein